MFGIADYPAFVLAVIVFLAIPGPGNLALLTSTAKGGLRGGLAATMGVIAGDQVLMWAAVAGVAAVLATQPDLFLVLQFLVRRICLLWATKCGPPSQATSPLSISPPGFTFASPCGSLCSTQRRLCFTWRFSLCL